MKEIVENILRQYFSKMREPKIEELGLDANNTLMSEAWCCFVTLYKNWEVRGSAGNIKEIHKNLASELISNTMQALTADKRFTPLTLDEAESIQVRVDKITERAMITTKEIDTTDPVKHGIIAINRNYEKLAVVLPNMSAKLMIWSDFLPVLKNKLEGESVNDKDYILYKIETLVESNY